MTKWVVLIALILSAASASILYYKIEVLEIPLLPDSTSYLWDIEAKMVVQGSGKSAKMTMHLPSGGEEFEILDERFGSQGLALGTLTQNGNRLAYWSADRLRGTVPITYRARVRRMDSSTTPKRKAPKAESPSFSIEELEERQKLLREISVSAKKDADGYVRSLIKLIEERAGDPSSPKFLKKADTNLERLELSAELLSLAGLPARVARGIKLLHAKPNVSMRSWLEVYFADEWNGYVMSARRPKLGKNYFVWWYGTKPITNANGARIRETSVAVVPNEQISVDPPKDAVEKFGKLGALFSFFSLSVEIQAIYRIILLVPLGALLVAILRNVIGVRTFGTFMPVLIALAFRETELLMGLALFLFVVFSGLIARFVLDKLRLLVVPRLAATLTFVILIMVGLGVYADHSEFEFGSAISLFPLVILTMTIERMCVVWDEIGPIASLRQLLGTLIVASVIYQILTSRTLQYMLFAFPELILVVLAIILLLGRYTGYRLTEILRFREFAGAR